MHEKLSNYLSVFVTYCDVSGNSLSAFGHLRDNLSGRTSNITRGIKHPIVDVERACDLTSRRY